MSHYAGEPLSPATHRRRQIGVAFILLVFVVGGLWLLWALAQAYRATTDTADWPGVSADVVSAAVTEVTDAETGAPAYDVDLRYRYIVNGQTYESNQLRRQGAERHATPEAAAEALQSYLSADGRTVLARYNPANPAESALNLSPPAYLPLFVFFYWAILLAFLIPAVRRWLADRSPGPE